MIKTFNENETEYVHFINVLTDAMRNCPAVRGMSMLTGDTIMLSPYHQLTIEQEGKHYGRVAEKYVIRLNRIVDGGFEYMVVDNGLDRVYRPEAVDEALSDFYEELAFYAPEESNVETMDIVDTLESLFVKYRTFINAGYSSGFA